MRIVLLPRSYLPEIGGVQTAVSGLARELRAKGHEVVIVTDSFSLRFPVEREPSGVIVHRMPFALPWITTGLGIRGVLRSLVRSVMALFSAPVTLSKLVRTLKKTKPHIVDLHYVDRNAAFALAARRFVDFSLVVSIWGEDVEMHFVTRSGIGRWLVKRTLQVADRVLSPSADLLAKAEQICPQVKEKSAVVGSGVFLDELRCPAKFAHPQRYVLSNARFVHKKGHDILIRAFSILRERNPELDLVLAGDGNQYADCVSLARTLGISDSVRFLGMVKPSQIPALLAGCEVFVLASRREPFGIAVLEAMAAQKPVVASRVGGLPEIITHMENGLLVEPESPEALAEAIQLLLDDPELGRRLADNGYQTVREKWTWERVVESYIAEYGWALGA